jgi:hypothetical protein
MFFESRNCQTSLSRKIGKVTVYKNIRGLYFNTKLSYNALNKNINSRFLGLNAHEITKLASIILTFPANEQLHGNSLGKDELSRTSSHRFGCHGAIRCRGRKGQGQGALRHVSSSRLWPLTSHHSSTGCGRQ